MTTTKFGSSSTTPLTSATTDPMTKTTISSTVIASASTDTPSTSKSSSSTTTSTTTESTTASTSTSSSSTTTSTTTETTTASTSTSSSSTTTSATTETTTASTSTSSSSTTTSATTETTTTITSTSTTATLRNPCVLGSLQWNTTGITIFNSPQTVAISSIYVDSNNTLYAVDETSNFVIWRLLNNAVNATIIAGIFGSLGSSSTQLSAPNDVYADKHGNVYVTDSNNHRIQKYINGSKNGTTIAGITGSAGSTLNRLNVPRYFAFDSTDTYMYVADQNNDRIMRYLTNSTSGTNGTLVAGGTGSANTNTSLRTPWSVYCSSSVPNNLFITNHNGGTVIRWTPGASSGVFVAGIPGAAGSNATMLDGPMGIKVDSYMNMYVVDSHNHRIQMFCANNQTATTIAGTGMAGNGTAQFNGPRGIAFDNAMNLYIGDTGNHRVQKFMRL